MSRVGVTALARGGVTSDQGWCQNCGQEWCHSDGITVVPQVEKQGWSDSVGRGGVTAVPMGGVTEVVSQWCTGIVSPLWPGVVPQR